MKKSTNQISFTTRKLLVKTDTLSYEEYNSFKEYFLTYEQMDSFLKSERDADHTPHIECEGRKVRVSLAYDYEMMTGLQEWFNYCTWKALN